MSAADPQNTELQRDVADSLGYIGDILYAQHDLAGALKPQGDSLAIRRRLLAADSTNEELMSDLAGSLERMAKLPGSGVTWADLHSLLADMDHRGVLSQSDRPLLAESEAHLANLLPN